MGVFYLNFLKGVVKVVLIGRFCVLVFVKVRVINVVFV